MIFPLSSPDILPKRLNLKSNETSKADKEDIQHNITTKNLSQVKLILLIMADLGSIRYILDFCINFINRLLYFIWWFAILFPNLLNHFISTLNLQFMKKKHRIFFENKKAHNRRNNYSYRIYPNNYWPFIEYLIDSCNKHLS